MRWYVTHTTPSLSIDVGVEIVVIIVVIIVVAIIVVEVWHDVDDGGGEHEVEGQEWAYREAVVGAELTLEVLGRGWVLSVFQEHLHKALHVLWVSTVKEFF